MQEQEEVRKQKWIIYSKVLDFINYFKLKYHPLADKKYWGAKMDMLMDNFAGIMQTLNEKKDIIIKTYLDRAAEVERRLKNRIIVTPG